MKMIMVAAHNTNNNGKQWIGILFHGNGMAARYQLRLLVVCMFSFWRWFRWKLFDFVEIVECQNHRLLVIWSILAKILHRLKVNRLMTIFMFEPFISQMSFDCAVDSMSSRNIINMCTFCCPQRLAVSKTNKISFHEQNLRTCVSSNHSICVEFLNGILGKMLESNAEQIKETNYFRTCNECWMFCLCIYNFSMAFSIDAVARSEFSLSIKKKAHTEFIWIWTQRASLVGDVWQYVREFATRHVHHTLRYADVRSIAILCSNRIVFIGWWVSGVGWRMGGGYTQHTRTCRLLRLFHSINIRFRFYSLHVNYLFRLCAICVPLVCAEYKSLLSILSAVVLSSPSSTSCVRCWQYALRTSTASFHTIK